MNRKIKIYLKMFSAKHATSKAYNVDCMGYMANTPSNFFELAIVDPPYGIGKSWKKSKNSPFCHHKSTYSNDAIPSKEYFQELFRVSKNQIIWGGNYYTEYLPPRNSWIVWSKGRSYDKQHTSEGELAWTSFSVPLRIVQRLWCGCAVCEPRSGVHPHEKPASLYLWLLKNYAKPGDKIFDSHLGSGSSRIAAYALGFDFYGCEVDKAYFDAQEKRFRRECMGEVVSERSGQVFKQLALPLSVIN
jgi:site-specific DNA-methyltransferase (adenine-specific)